MLALPIPQYNIKNQSPTSPTETSNSQTKNTSKTNDSNCKDNCILTENIKAVDSNIDFKYNEYNEYNENSIISKDKIIKNLAVGSCRSPAIIRTILPKLSKRSSQFNSSFDNPSGLSIKRLKICNNSSSSSASSGNSSSSENELSPTQIRNNISEVGSSKFGTTQRETINIKPSILNTKNLKLKGNMMNNNNIKNNLNSGFFYNQASSNQTIPNQTSIISRKRPILIQENQKRAKKLIFPFQHTAITTPITSKNIKTSISDINTINSTKTPFLIENQINTISSETTNTLKQTFQNKYKYLKRLKQLPSQMNKPNFATSFEKNPFSTQNIEKNLTNQPKKIFVDDAINILEHILKEKEENMRQEFTDELTVRLSEQHNSFCKYNEEYIKNQINATDCSYLN